jgi:hypothetical protein
LEAGEVGLLEKPFNNPALINLDQLREPYDHPNKERIDQ